MSSSRNKKYDVIDDSSLIDYNIFSEPFIKTYKSIGETHKNDEFAKKTSNETTHLNRHVRTTSSVGNLETVRNTQNNTNGMFGIQRSSSIGKNLSDTSKKLMIFIQQQLLKIYLQINN